MTDWANSNNSVAAAQDGHPLPINHRSLECSQMLKATQLLLICIEDLIQCHSALGQTVCAAANGSKTLVRGRGSAWPVWLARPPAPGRRRRRSARIPSWRSGRLAVGSAGVEKEERGTAQHVARTPAATHRITLISRSKVKSGECQSGGREQLPMNGFQP
ncbi:hypothetical protein AV530_003607 [Patagioenas fasciata monilis]|uniref:Uncharacterized protein n=1 Tax=Patagioenas fasciata monilis TaxID=372326 RepID=A0A1V4KZI8_PATFA|nr:hypothetical protein AV530_003607 [Patagioenas fasciata monilis]